jgi:hypothetical protein
MNVKNTNRANFQLCDLLDRLKVLRIAVVGVEKSRILFDLIDLKDNTALGPIIPQEAVNKALSVLIKIVIA